MKPSFSYAASSRDLLSGGDVGTHADLMMYARQVLGINIPTDRKARNRQVAVVKNEMQVQGLSLDDMVETVKWCSRTKRRPRDLWGVLRYAAEREEDTEEIFQKASAIKRTIDDPYWINRLSTSSVGALRLAVAEWRLQT